MAHETDAQSHETPHTRWQRRMAARPLAPVQTTWGQERIANELLLKLSLRVSPRTVRK